MLPVDVDGVRDSAGGVLPLVLVGGFGEVVSPDHSSLPFASCCATGAEPGGKVEEDHSLNDAMEPVSFDPVLIVVVHSDLSISSS